MLDGVRRTAKAAAAMAGAPEPVVEFEEAGAAVINDEAVVQRTVAALQVRSWASRRWCEFRPSRQAKTFRSM